MWPSKVGVAGQNFRMRLPKRTSPFIFLDPPLDWDENWLNSLTEGAEMVDEDENFDVPPPPPKI